MRKILLVFDGINFSEGAFEFARRLNEKNQILVTGVFVPQVDFANLWSYAAAGSGVVTIPLIEDDEAELIEKNIEQFKQQCEKNKIEYRVHKDFYGFALPELKKESRFADLIIIGSEKFYANIGVNGPNDYVKDALHDAECPVLVVPENFSFPESNILSYDGSESSVFAIKQFAYLFPEFVQNPTLLVYAKNEAEGEIPNMEYVEELAARHFPDLTIMKLHFDPKEYFAAWTSEKKNPILVSGSFGRSSFSRVFKKSFIKDVIKDHKLPIFITHR
jgi:nucleotide-binding universal stress UspA family protein